MQRTFFLTATASLMLVAASPAGADPAASFARFERQVADAKKSMMGDPQHTLQLASQALATAKALPPSPRAQLAVATAQWLDAEAHLGLNDVTAAVPLIDAALATVDALAPDTKLQGDLLRTRGAALATEGKLSEGLAYFQRAYRVFVAAHEPRSQAIELQDIGQVFDSAGDYPRALTYYAQAIEAYQKDSALLLANYNNRAEALRKLNRPMEAEREYLAALREADKQGSAVLRIRILCNLADVQGERGAFGAAASSLARAERLSASGEGKEWLSFVLGTRGKVAVAAGDYAQAGALFDRMFAGVDVSKTDASYTEFHDAASRTYDRLGKPELALAHLRAFQRLDQGARELTASASSQLAAARFDFANQNLRISNLKAGQLRQQVQIERQHARMRTLVIAALLVIALGIVGFLSFALVTGRRGRDRLRAINTDLERALKAKTDFLAMTSHEIRTPLNGILGMTQVLMTERDMKAEHRERIRLMHGAGETMRALVDDILDVAKMETGTIEVTAEDTDVAGILRDVAALWRDQAAAKGVTLHPVATELPPLVRTDAARLRQVVFNLLSNAVKFTLEGEVTVRAFIADDGGEQHLIVQVEDTGIGIEAEQHEAIFEAFHQADAATTRRFGGTGLGLSICRKVSAALGGTVSVESAPAVGSTFTLRLPVTVAETIEAPVGARVIADDLKRARLVLVAGNLLTQAMLQSVLEPAVTAVHSQALLATALADAERDAPDHFLIDVSSLSDEPEHHGQLLGRLTELAMRERVRVTLLAGPTSDIAAIAAHAPGAQVVVKPVAGSTLIARMAELYAAQLIQVTEVAA